MSLPYALSVADVAAPENGAATLALPDGDLAPAVVDIAPPVELMCSVAGQTVPKPSNDRYTVGTTQMQRASEDRIGFTQTETALRAVVSDGAGSSGMYCGAWAEALVNRLPEAPITDIDGLNTWIDGFWKSFSEKYKKVAASDGGKLTKFVREGSYATLVASWLDQAEGSVGLNWIGYGDSLVLIFTPEDPASDNSDLALLDSHPPTLGALEHDPHLLNWKDLPEGVQLRAGKTSFDGPATIVLASDGIGQYLILRYLVDLHNRPNLAGLGAKPGKAMLDEFHHLARNGASSLADAVRTHLDHPGDGFAVELDALRASLASKADFDQLIHDHHADKLLPNDDASLIIIDITVRPPAQATASDTPQGLDEGPMKEEEAS